MNITTAVFRPWLLYTVQSNFAFILFEFFSVPKFSTPDPRWNEHSIFSGLFSLRFFSFPFSSDYGMFGQGFTFIYFIPSFGQTNNVDLNPVNATGKKSQFFRFAFALLLLFTFLIWLWYVWTGSYFDLLDLAFLLSQQPWTTWIWIQHLLDHAGDWSAFENHDYQHQRWWTGNKRKLINFFVTYLKSEYMFFMAVWLSQYTQLVMSTIHSEKMQSDKAFVLKLFKAVNLFIKASWLSSVSTPSVM